ncbi:putative sulfate exporter family transporter [Kribbella turkmenica]|uniref:Putative sulfate exporter family transporter n=1 Tax=Kribbella turkmenica TaxID=2530375 RepID=A0A4V2YEC3_9ACTN|nr:putative sulfate exporter family transporter [Kribbella turkmenica]TDD18746.1 putative sulfate exporter family transporter [Kribbella turkmenica]
MVQVEVRPIAVPRFTGLPGLVVVLALTGVAVPLGRLVPVVGGPVFGIVLGVLAGLLVPPLRSELCRPGYTFASKTLLQLSIVVLGTGLSLQQVVHVGGSSLPVMLGTLAIALGGAWLFGRLLGVRGDTQTLIGVGTAICGASAIAATTAAINPKRSSVAYALATIFTFNIVAVLTFPPLGHLLGLGPEAFGLWAGTAINDTSSVVAAGYAYSQQAGDQALVVKLTRSLMLVPIVMALVVLRSRRDAQATARLPWRKLVPLFLIGFLAAAGLRTAGLVPVGWLPTLSLLGTCLITAALVAIGLSLRPRELRDTGPRPLLLGAVLWVLVAAGSLAIQSFS